MVKLNVAYFGTPEFSANTLDYLINNLSDLIDVKLIATNPDQKVGRKQILTASAVKKCAQIYGIHCFNKAISGKNNPNLQELKELMINKAIDYVLVFAYGSILPKHLLDTLPNKFINIHPSELPKYRGPSPTIWPLINNNDTTAVSYILMDEKMDHGPIIYKTNPVIIAQNTTRGILEKHLTVVINTSLRPLFTSIVASEYITLEHQDETKATFTRLLVKEDGFISYKLILYILNRVTTLDFGASSKLLYEIISNQPVSSSMLTSHIFNLYRGLKVWPGIWTMITINGLEKRLKLIDCEIKNDMFIINKVQLEGKNIVDRDIFERDYGLLLH
jgi:methionyl-tRNA formyltransferase